MSVLFDISSGWTEPLGPFTLKIGGIPRDLSLLTIVPIIHDASGTVYQGAGVVTPDPDQVTNPGQLSYAPAATDFVFNPSISTYRQAFKLHWKVTDVNGKVATFPNGAPDEIGVYPL
jgi:hypothetical protein